MERLKLLWFKLCLVNLAIVALLGFILRSKILFPIRFIDYRSFLSAHSHFAFSGWVGMALTTFLIYNLLPSQVSAKRFYQLILAIIEISSLGMAVSFPLQGYGFWSIFFSSSYIVTNFVFAAGFFRDIVKTKIEKIVKILSVAAISSLLISAIGPLGLVYILLGKSRDAILYRDSIYTFLHFQYNGFFTLSVFAMFFNFLFKKGVTINPNMKKFAVALVGSVLPALFLSLLWHNNTLYYILGSIGCLFLLVNVWFFMRVIGSLKVGKLYSHKIGSFLVIVSMVSFGIKSLLNAGTIIPSLGNAVFGDRPVIIGFLHLVFLGFVSFFILAQLTEEGVFTKNGKPAKLPLIVFATGIFANEVLLAIQGLGVLFMTNSQVYNWMLWLAAIILFAGSLLLAITAGNKKAST